MSGKPDAYRGLELSGLFYERVERPVLDTHFPGLAHSAALIGPGSEVLGFDDEMSRDHHWGPRVMLFLRPDDHVQHASSLDERLRWTLPRHFLGYPTNFTPPDPEDHGTQLLQGVESGPINHRVETLTPRGFLLDYLGFDLDDQLTPGDWLTFPQHKLRSLTDGAVYHDGVDLRTVLGRFSYYPPDVWRYLLAAGWTRVGQEEHLMGRAGYVGDDLGSRIIASRLVHDLMRLCFLMEKRYAPYPKWFGAAFSHLTCGPDLAPLLAHVLQAETWQKRDQRLAKAYGFLAAQHNALGITETLPVQPSAFFGRPFCVIWGERFANAICAGITDPTVRRMAAAPLIGGIDQFSDSTDLLENPHWRATLRELFAR